MESKDTGPADIRYQTALETMSHLREQRYYAAYELAGLLHDAVAHGPSNSVCEMDTEQAVIIASELQKLNKALACSNSPACHA
ncbi:hypothetical protein OL229_04935 [Neisseriaceae bacterium JH1-16]|nr:hypothetical protein [Neisseriaceae bacterium JH1-16]